MPASGRISAKERNKPTKQQPKLLQPQDLPDLLQGPCEKIEVEIGCGNGHFMAEYCSTNPNVLFVGVEIKKKRCLKAQAKIEKRHQSNARVIHGTAEAVIEELPDDSVNAFHLYFPDPWPKARHRRRRFLRQGNLETLRCKLKPGGFIFFVTDYFDYYLHTKVLFLLHEGLDLIAQPPSISVFRSVFAQRFADKGKKVRALTVRKTSPSERKTSPSERKTPGNTCTQVQRIRKF
jgi:tRNA (guanine-N(7)-)-methyltransferase